MCVVFRISSVFNLVVREIVCDTVGRKCNKYNRFTCVMCVIGDTRQTLNALNKRNMPGKLKLVSQNFLSRYLLVLRFYCV